MKTYTIVLRCPSSARFLPEEGQRVTLESVPRSEGPSEAKLRTRWIDEGFDAPTPRELWIEVVLGSRSLDDAMAAATAVARFLASALAFTANVMTGTPEVHIAFDSTPGEAEREFLEVFLPDERGIPREGRIVRTGEYSVILERLMTSDQAARVSRSLHQYELALRHWYLGGEYLALAHLYMAVEALTKAVLRQRCDDAGVDQAELARQNAIDPDDPERPRWRPVLEAWVRRELIFEGDISTYQAAKGASDGIEHGYMELNEVHRRALESTEQTFRYVRQTILRLLDVSADDHPDLANRYPRDVASLRKMVRGHFIGATDDTAPPGEEYPYLEWKTSIRELTRSGEDFSINFNETFTVRCAEGISFRGQSFEARGRLEPGKSAIVREDVRVLEGSPKESTEGGRAAGLSALSKANQFASGIAAEGSKSGMRPLKSIVFGLFSEQVSLFESIHTLLLVDRVVEGMMLMNRLLEGTCLLQTIAGADDGDGIAVRVKIDAMERQRALFDEDVTAVRRLSHQIDELKEKARLDSVDVPDVVPSLEAAAFFAEHSKDMLFTEEVARADDLAITLHSKTSDGTVAIHTQVQDPTLWSMSAGLAVDCLTASAVAFATEMGWEYDVEAADTLHRSAALLQEPENGSKPHTPG